MRQKFFKDEEKNHNSISRDNHLILFQQCFSLYLSFWFYMTRLSEWFLLDYKTTSVSVLNINKDISRLFVYLFILGQYPEVWDYFKTFLMTLCVVIKFNLNQKNKNKT